MKAQTQAQTNPPKTNPKGMEVFLSGSQHKEEVKVNNQTNDEKMKISTKEEEIKKAEKTQSEQSTKVKDIEEKIKQIENELANIRVVDFSTFNDVAFRKQLLFKVLFIKERIYLEVKSDKKSAIIGVTAPKWGGTSLRYLITSCSTNYCKVIQKKTSKGTVLAYQSIIDNTDEDQDIDDIFD